jgi:arylsulfatase A-like enzyme
VSRPSVSTAALSGLLVVACGGGTRTGEAVPPAAERPHVLILVLDACRADRFSAYGFARETTPAFDALAREPESVLFRRHFAQAPHTRASTASLFTGVFPFQHGVFNEDDLTPELRGKDRYRGRRIAEEYETLAERFAGAGYRTAAMTSNPMIAGKGGYAQGFDLFLAPSRKRQPASDPELVERAVAFLAAGGAPALAYVHVSGCHGPVRPERRDPGYFARWGGAFDEEAFRRAGIDPGNRRFKWSVRAGKVVLDERAVAYLETVYEAALAQVDRETVARLVASLARAGLYDRTLLVVTADHGEELYDHGGVAHGRTVWNEVLHVPLLVKFPKGAKPAGLPSTVERSTQTVDLYPSLTKAIGISAPAGMPGRDLFDPTARAAVVWAQAPGSWSIVDFPLKVVVFAEERRAELFDLAADLHERRNLAGERAAEVRRLIRLGEALRKALPKIGAEQRESEIALDPETIEQLRALGYLE